MSNAAASHANSAIPLDALSQGLLDLLQEQDPTVAAIMAREADRQALYARYDGPLSPEARAALDDRARRGSRRAAEEAWGTVRFWAKRALAARRIRDLTERDRAEHWLNAALLTWQEARAAEQNFLSRKERAA